MRLAAVSLAGIAGEVLQLLRFNFINLELTTHRLKLHLGSRADSDTRTDSATANRASPRLSAGWLAAPTSLCRSRSFYRVSPGHAAMKSLPYFCRGEVIRGFGRGSKELGIHTGEWITGQWGSPLTWILADAGNVRSL